MKLIYKNGGFVFMKTEDILNLIEKRIEELYSLKDELLSKAVDEDFDEDSKELLKLEGKLSELVHLKATIININNIK